MIKEGKIKLDIEMPDKVSKKLDVFYNPKMVINRDSSIQFIKSYAKKSNPLRVALPLAGSGVRGVRFLVEIPDYIAELSFNDLDKLSVLKIIENLELNHIRDFNKFKLFRQEAQTFLLESKGFDYIDLDPFGSPNPFLDSACQRLARDGILAITATDTAPLCGSYPKVCLRDYDAMPINNELMHIAGLRILIRKAQLVASQYDKALIPMYSFSKDHYFRLYLKCVKSKSLSNDIVKLHKFMLFCPDCRNYEYSTFNAKKCGCGRDMLFAGKMFSGDLWDQKITSKINLIPEINEECLFSGKYYDIHEMCSCLKTKSIPKFNALITELNKVGKASRSHFSKKLLKTSVDHSKLVEIIRKLS